MMKAEIITTGTEILLGEIVNTNSAYLAVQLAELGIDLYYMSSVGDNLERMTALLRQAWERSDLIITTGGLGPSQGDITRNAVALMVDEKMVVDNRLKKMISQFFQERNVVMSPNNIKQAMLIPSARSLLNPRGTAPGWWVEKNGRIIITLPGPPMELETMWKNEVVPRLKEKSGYAIVSLTLKTLNLSESLMDQMLGNLMLNRNPTLAMYARQDGIHVRITAKARSRLEAGGLIGEMEKAVRAKLGDYIWGINEDTLEALLARRLKARNMTLAVAERNDGGYLVQQLASSIPLRGIFQGGLTLGPEAVKPGLGMVSEIFQSNDDYESRAIALATLAGSKFESDFGIGIDGKIDDNSGKMWAAITGPFLPRPEIVMFQGRLPLLSRRIISLALLRLMQLLK